MEMFVRELARDWTRDAVAHRQADSRGLELWSVQIPAEGR